MNSYERVRAVLEHKEPDCIPLDIGGTGVTGININTCREVSKLIFPNKEDVCIQDKITQIAEVSEQFRQKLEIDTEGVNPDALPDSETEDSDDKYNYITDEFGIKWAMPKIGGLYYDMCTHPLSETDTIGGLKAYRFPDINNSARYSNIGSKAKRIHLTDNRAAILNRSCGGIFELALYLRGFENFLCDLACNGEFAAYLLELITDFKISYWEHALREDNGNSLVISEADDFATQSGLMISRDTYRKFFKPLHRRLFSKIRDMSPNRVYIFFHSCGAIRELIPDLLDVGVDILNPVQISAQGMNPSDLKREYGHDLTFWGGGIDTQSVLPCGSRREIAENVKRNIDSFARGGGFVFCAVHNIQGDVSPENFLTMWETFQELRIY